MKFFFDIGANSGKSMIDCTKDKNNIVYAFEPNPNFLEHLSGLSKSYPNYIVINKAVSNVNGKFIFNIAENDDNPFNGASSLNDFNDNLEKTWPGRNDFKVTKQIEVDVVKLKDFIEENKIKEIEYLHVDAQGNDLEVLFGMEQYISIIKEGIIEMPTSHEVKLYKNQKYVEKDAIEFLKKNGFEITDIISNDVERNEVNIKFKKIN